MISPMIIDTELVERTIGANVKLYRNAIGMSATQLGARFAQVLNKRQVARQVMYMMESGNRSFRAAELLALAQILGVSVDDLFRSVDFTTVDDIPKTPKERLEEAKAGRDVAWEQVRS